jgi:hypothetical protein
MINRAFLILFCFLLVACSGNDEKKIPDSVLPKEKMTEVLVDIHLLEAVLNLNAGNINKDNIQGIDLFKKHNITKKKFDDSYAFYTENPEILTEIYDMVLNELSKLQATAVNTK